MVNEPEAERFIAARKIAEQVVEGMQDEVLRARAFEITYQSLLAQSSNQHVQGSGAVARAAPPERVRKPRTGVRALIEGLLNDGFFDDPQSLTDVMNRLRDDGHRYRQFDLSKPLQRLTQDKLLRRHEGTKNGGAKKVFLYERHPGYQPS